MYFSTGNFFLDLAFNCVLFLAGTYILIKGSDLFVDAAAAIARKWHVSELVIGLTLVSIGTSLPELATSLCAQWGGDGDFVIGNIGGSNVTNITLILGAALAVGGAMPFQKKLLTRDILLMNVFFLAASLLFILGPDLLSARPFFIDFGISRLGGALLLTGGFFYCRKLFYDSAGKGKNTEPPVETEETRNIRLGVQFTILAFALVMVSIGSKIMVDTVSWGARAAGISTIVISATIVAFGTSVPELAVTIAGVLKKKSDLAIGNIVGSCTFNILLIFGASAVMRPLVMKSVRAGIITMGLNDAAGLLLLAFMLDGYRKKHLTRFSGFLLLAFYAGFLALQVWLGFSK